ncbi:auxin-responsive protein IAA10-like isoform X2 [Typha angustifolia]|uniref:auxin-responsive protein IAA10-like isoform X2 n=1 Tax=Typha angustifolia TaxID=59011 RepID=UPI003C2ACAB9
MRGVCGFSGGVASSESMTPATAAAEAEKRKGEEEEEVEEIEEEREEELELGLSLGAKKVPAGSGTVALPWGQGCRILTANDFPSMVSRASPVPSPNSSVSSSSATLGGVAGSKRAAAPDPISPEAAGSAHRPIPMVVGWPPVRAFRMNSLFNLSKDSNQEVDATNPKKTNHNSSISGNGSCIKEGSGINDQERKSRTSASSLFVKVNMDGDPIGRKVDLNAHHSYESLASSLELMFHKPTMPLGASSSYVAKASKLLDGSSEFALTYEDKDGDWMLVGDVPWGMFLETVKRLRIMRTSDANGLAPRFRSFNKSRGLVGSSKHS